MKQQEYIGFNSVRNLKKIFTQHRPKKIFLVTGRNSYERSGSKNAIEPILSGHDSVHFYDFEVNPKVRDIEKGIKIFKENNCDFVIAVGGGSVIDVAKAVNILAANDIKPDDCVKNKKPFEKKGVALAAIPTTSGSGSEATKFAVIYIDKIKYSLDQDYILPDYAIVDPQFTMNLPPYITACSGMDALSQAVESYWCVNSTDESKKYAKEAIKLVMDSLADAVNNPSENSRGEMARAAYLAGKAVSISKTTACHSISYPITSYFDVSHGHAVALTLAQMLLYNSQVTEDDLLDKRGVGYVKNTINEIASILGSSSTEDASKKITALMADIGLKTKLIELKIKTQEDMNIIIKHGFNPERVKNNPRKLTEEALRRILHNIN